jgi:hypothetical protein
MDTRDLTQSHVFVDGQLVNNKVANLTLAIKDYCAELEVKWIPPAAREPGQAAYAIIHDAPGNAPYVMFYVKNDEDFDERVLAKIIANDQRNGVKTMSDLESWETAQALVQKQAFLDKMEEANDIAKHVLRTHKNTYRVTKDLVIKD